MTYRDYAHWDEGAALGSRMEVREKGMWWLTTRVIKKWAQDMPSLGASAGDLIAPFSAAADHMDNPLTVEGNLLLYGGGDILIERLIQLNPSTSSTGAVLQAYSSGNAVIGVGISTATSTGSQTALQAVSTAKKYKGMASATYPAHTTGVASTANQTLQFRSTFAASEGNFAWREWAIGNSSSQRHLNRKVQNLGTKTTAATFDITCTITIT